MTLSARSRRVRGLLVEGDVADEVEVVHVGHPLLRLHLVEVDALVLQLLADRLLLLLGRPAADEVVERRVPAADVELRVVDDAFLGQKTALGVVDRDVLADDVDFASRRVDDILARRRRRIGRRIGRRLA